ncbi:hypothetical protein BJY00DRAFT_276196 [Aspergillus carlsbadensis]|nr:hypothetical protein BJY00DRAFT_276196 [Aspergillus carlsbadensis]
MDRLPVSSQEHEKEALPYTTDSLSLTPAFESTETNTFLADSGNGNMSLYPAIAHALSGYIPGPPAMDPNQGSAHMASPFQEAFMSYDHYQSPQSFTGWPAQYTVTPFSNVPPHKVQGFTMNHLGLNSNSNSNSFANNLVYHPLQTRAVTSTFQQKLEHTAPFPHAQTLDLQCKWEGCRSQTTFKRANDLIRHIRTIHVDRDAYRCPFEGCGMAFGRKDHLRVHQGVHLRRN